MSLHFQFYHRILIVVLVILICYIFLSFYNIAWLSFSKMGTLSKVMLSYRAYMRKTKGATGVDTNTIWTKFAFSCYSGVFEQVKQKPSEDLVSLLSRSPQLYIGQKTWDLGVTGRNGKE